MTNTIKLVTRDHNYEEKHAYRILIGKAPGKASIVKNKADMGEKSQNVN
jgi:hypothetical protein